MSQNSSNSDEDFELTERKDYSRRSSVDTETSVTFRSKSNQHLANLVEITETGTFDDISDDDEETLGPMTDSDIGLLPNTKKTRLLFFFRFLRRPWAFIAAFIAIILLCIGTILITILDDSTTSIVLASKALVSSESHLCSAVGRATLQKGGNAVDAAVATSFCLGVVRPFSSGIGGGGYMVIYLNSTNKVSIDFREMSPLNSNYSMLKNFQFENVPEDVDVEFLSNLGPMFIGVPGELYGLEYAQKTYGLLPWEEVLFPAIELANNGFPCDSFLVNQIEQMLPIIRYHNITDIFLPMGILPSAGDMLTNVALGVTLQRIADNGTSIFYGGDLTETIVNEVQSLGGVLNVTDFLQYTINVSEPLSSFWHGLELLSSRGSSVGGMGIMYALNILERYNLPKIGFSSSTLHKTVEAMKYMFGGIYGMNVTEATLLNKEFASQQRAKITETTLPLIGDYMIDPISDVLGNKGSNSVTVVDENRCAVSLTSTLNGPGGSWVYLPTLGIFLNNALGAFTQETNSTLKNSRINSEKNLLGPLKRPLSCIAPIIVLKDTSVNLVVSGSSGNMVSSSGMTIMTSVLQTILDVLAYGVEPLSSTQKARLHHQLIPNKVFVEDDYPSSLIESLKKAGHVVEEVNSNFAGNVQVILVRDDGLLSAGADPRKASGADGY